MKHHLITAIIMALTLVPITSNAYDFSAVNDDGVTIYYNIISEAEKTCKVCGSDYGYKSNIVLPSYANGYKVVEISSFAFCEHDLASITIPETVTSIGESAFSYCVNLTSVSLPNSITKIEDFVFSQSYNLESVNIPNSVTTIGESAFSGCRHLTMINIPNSVVTIGTGAFSGCDFTSVTIPKSVESIGISPFSGCKNLESITVEKGNPNYSSENNCNAIIETKSHVLISGCKNSEIPNFVTSIGKGAFRFCTGLQSIIIDNSVTSIEESAFSNCIGLRSVIIGNSVTSISNYAFYDCTGLETLTIANSVRAIGEKAFSNCSSLKTIYSEITDFFDIDKSVFSGSENTTLYVPKGMATTYRSSTGWSVIKYIEEIPDDTPDVSFLISCSNRGSVSINGSPTITNKIATADINEGSDNTFIFTPKPGCRLEQVILNGLDITANVQNNTLTCTIPANSQMIITFATEPGDMNNDGTIDISDVVAIVNKILSN